MTLPEDCAKEINKCKSHTPHVQEKRIIIRPLLAAVPLLLLVRVATNTILGHVFRLHQVLQAGELGAVRRVGVHHLHHVQLHHVGPVGAVAGAVARVLGRKLLSCSQCQEFGQRVNLAPDWFFVLR